MNPEFYAGCPTSRGRFIWFIRELYGFLGHPAPTPDAGDDEALAVELQIDELRFFVVHLPEHPARLTAYACVGVVPEENALAVCRQLLALNIQLACNGHATLGVDEDSGEIFYMFKAGMDSIEPRGFLGSLQNVAREVEAWIEDHLAGHGSAMDASGLSLQGGFAQL